MNKLNELINKIDLQIKNLESTNTEYKQTEREILEEICKNNFFSNITINTSFKISELLISCIIICEKYDNIDQVLEILQDIKNEINNLNAENLFKLVNCYLTSIEEEKDKKFIKQIQKILKKLKIRCYEKIEKLFSLIEQDYIELIPIIKFIEEQKNTIIEMNSLFNNRINIDKTFKNYVNSTYNMSLIRETLLKINTYFVLLESKNNKIKKEKIKKLNKYNSLKKNLELTHNVEEITNVEEIIKLIDEEELKNEVLKYIADKNKKYYIGLEKKYQKVKENSVANYIKIFADKNINFNSYTILEQQSLLEIDIEFINEVFKFLEKIGYEIKRDVINIVYGTNLDIISNIENYIKKRFLTNNFVKNNINIILSKNLSNQYALYETLVNNINTLLNYGINIIGIEEDIEILISNPNRIIENLSIIDKYNINIKTRTLKNYKFLLDSNLEEKIIGFKEEGIRLEDDIDILNSDINIIKRIKICNCINVDIYEDGKIRKEILNGNLFFIPDSKLDEYINDDILKLSLYFKNYIE